MTIDTSPAARRAFRKRVMAASAERHPRAIVRPAHPSGIELAYTRILRDTSKTMDAAIVAALKSEGLIRRNDAVRELEPDETTIEVHISKDDVERLTRYLTRKLATVASYASLAGSIDKMASRLVDYSRSQWRAQLKASLGIDLTADPDLSRLVERFRKRQGDLIVSLAHEKVARVKAVLREQGFDARVETIAARIQESAETTESRAMLIARTEVTTMNSQLAVARHVAAGVTEFEWSTSRDSRVRPSHAALEGKTFEYASPPVVDGEPLLPGQFCNCRCVAIAIIPDEDS